MVGEVSGEYEAREATRRSKKWETRKVRNVKPTMRKK